MGKFLNLFEKPLNMVKSIEKQLVEQEVKKYVFKMKELDKEDVELNKYEIFKEFYPVLQKAFLEQMSMEEIVDRMVQKEMIEGALIVDGYLNILHKMGTFDNSFLNNKYNVQWKTIEAFFTYSVEQHEVSQGAQETFGIRFIDKVCVVRILPDKLFAIAFLPSPLSNIQEEIVEVLGKKLSTISNLRDLFADTISGLESFDISTEIAEDEKSNIEKEWINASVSLSSNKNGRRFIKNRNTTTLITPADDDVTKFSPRPRNTKRHSTPTTTKQQSCPTTFCKGLQTRKYGRIDVQVNIY